MELRSVSNYMEIILYIHSTYFIPKRFLGLV